MEKYLADRSYALIYRMCQVQAFSSRLHARGFPAIGKYEPKTPPRTAGVTKCVIGFSRYSGLARRFCREGPIRATQKPVARAFLAPGLADAPLSPRPHFRFCRPGGVVRLRTDNTMPGEFVLLLLSRFSARCRNCSPPGAFIGNRALRIVRMPNRPEYRLLSGRSGSRPAPEPPPRRSPAEASYSVRTDTAIICFVMWRAYPPRSCDISQPRLEAHRPCLRPFPAARSLPTEGSSRAQAGSIGNAKAGTSGHMIRDGDGLRVVSGISVRFPFSARRGRPLRAA